MMPIFTLLGIPARYPQQNLNTLVRDFKLAVSDMQTLHLTPDDVLVYPVLSIPHDVGPKPEAITLFIDLFPGAERKPETIQEMARRCGQVIRSHFHTAEMGCYPRFIDQKMEFSLRAEKHLMVADAPPCEVCGSSMRPSTDEGKTHNCANCNHIRTTTIN